MSPRTATLLLGLSPFASPYSVCPGLTSPTGFAFVVAVFHTTNTPTVLMPRIAREPTRRPQTTVMTDINETTEKTWGKTSPFNVTPNESTEKQTGDLKARIDDLEACVEALIENQHEIVGKLDGDTGSEKSDTWDNSPFWGGDE